MKKYKLYLKCWVTSSQRANYLLSLQMHLKSYFSGPINVQDIDARLRIIDSYINEFNFIVRNTKHNGTYITRKVYSDKIDIYSLTGSRVILTISFVPHE
jgi:hypothetical protein